MPGFSLSDQSVVCKLTSCKQSTVPKCLLPSLSAAAANAQLNADKAGRNSVPKSTVFVRGGSAGAPPRESG